MKWAACSGKGAKRLGDERSQHCLGVSFSEVKKSWFFLEVCSVHIDSRAGIPRVSNVARRQFRAALTRASLASLTPESASRTGLDR